MDLDNYCCGAHGLSIYMVWLTYICAGHSADLALQTTTLSGKTYNVLLDSGPEGLSIERNVKAMKVDLSELDAIVLSHWHRDRTPPS